MKQFFLFVLLSIPFFLVGQNQLKIDFALKELNQTQTATERKATYKKLSTEFLSNKEFKSFEQFDKQVRKLYSDNDELMAVSLLNNSLFYKFQGNNDKSLVLADSLIRISKDKFKDEYESGLFISCRILKTQNKFNQEKQRLDDIFSIKGLSKESKIDAYLLSAILNQELGEHETSISNYLIIDSLAENDPFLQYKINKGVCNSFLMLKQYDKAEVYMKRAQDYLLMKSDSFELYIFNANLVANLYKIQGNLKVAENYLTDANSYFFRKGHLKAYQETNVYLGEINTRLKNYKQAIKYYQPPIDYKRNSSDPLKSVILVESHLGMAISYAGLGKSNLTQLHIDSAKFYVKNFKSDHMDIMILKHEMYARELLGDYKGAYLAYKTMSTLNWEIDSLSNLKQINELEEKYQSAKKEAEILALKTQSELDEKQKVYQRNIFIGVVLITSLIGLFFFLLFRNRQNTNHKLKEVDAIKTRFFENISHEFRTPITLIKLPISKRLNTGEPLSERNVETIHNNATRLQNLVEDLLSLSELDAGKMKVKRTEQNPIIQSKTLAAQFDSYAASKGITYTKIIENKQFSAIYDKTVLDKVLTNLISNAIKHTSRGDEVTIEITCVINKLKIIVSDTGTGIAKEDHQKIFDRFYQVGEKDESNQGSGIGLALIKRLLDINEGDIKVESEIDKGSSFIVHLPLENVKEIIEVEPEPEPEPIAKPITSESIIDKGNIIENINLSQKPQLLIVEDNEELSYYLKELFQDDFEITIANNGQEGLEKGLETVPDIILSDWMMPKMNGIELCKEIKTNSITSHIPFVLLTAKADVENKVEGFETGADAYFSKPFNYKELKAHLNNLIAQRKLLLQKFSSSKESILPVSTTNSRDIVFWEDFKGYLELNIQSPELSAKSIGEALSMSRMQLHRKLTAITGQTVGNIIKNQRMQLAKKLLKDPALRVSDICFEVGYADHSAFARAFKNEFGVSPTEYKKRK